MLVKRDHANGIVDICRRTSSLPFPLFPGFSPVLCKQIAFFKALCARKLQRAIAHEKNVIGFLHHAPRHSGGRGNLSKPSHRTITESTSVNNRSIDFDLALGIGISAEPNALDRRIAFRHFNTPHNSIERRATVFQNLPGGLIRR